MLVDTHAHIHDEPFEHDLNDVVRNAKEAGVQMVIDIGVDLKTSNMAVANADAYPEVYAAVGVHPHEASYWNASVKSELKSLFTHPKVVAMGEIGLDYHYHFSTSEEQTRAFDDQLRLARTSGMPVIIHSREAMDDTLAQIKSVATGGWQGVFHCYGDTEKEIPEILELGFYVSFTGVVTFRNFDRWEVVRAVPLDRLLLETDAPYMAPVPLRGRRNEPAFLVHTAQCLADFHRLSLGELAEQTTQNAIRLFGLKGVAG